MTDKPQHFFEADMPAPVQGETVRQRMERIMAHGRERRRLELEAMIAGEDDGYLRGKVHVLPNIMKVTYDGTPVRIQSARNFRIIDCLAFRPQRLRSALELAELIDLDEDVPAGPTIGKAMQHIRRAFSVASRKTYNPIGTVYSEGYYWRGPADGVDL